MRIDEALREATFKVLEELCCLSVDDDDDDLEVDEVEFRVTVGFRGAVTGSMTVSLHGDVIGELTDAIADDGASEDEQRSAVAELGHSLCAHFVPLVASTASVEIFDAEVEGGFSLSPVADEVAVVTVPLSAGALRVSIYAADEELAA
ncbi:MAG: hypothetical protein AAGF12_37295 [Myxococcota bacterium]